MAKGLDDAGIQVIRGMLDREASGDEVRDRIWHLLKNDGWNLDSNLDFIRELSFRGYTETAQYLAGYVGG